MLNQPMSSPQMIRMFGLFVFAMLRLRRRVRVRETRPKLGKRFGLHLLDLRPTPHALASRAPHPLMRPKTDSLLARDRNNGRVNHEQRRCRSAFVRVQVCRAQTGSADKTLGVPVIKRISVELVELVGAYLTGDSRLADRTVASSHVSNSSPSARHWRASSA